MTDLSAVSVIIPTWNRAPTIIAAISSALGQSHPPLEVLVCDDASTDGTEAVVRGIGDPRVRWLPGPRGGRPAIPRNRGIAAACGEWLAFLDSDDEWLPDKLRQQFSVVSKLGVDAVCSNTWRVVPGVEARTPLLPPNDARLTWSDLARRNQVHCSSAVVRRSLFGAAHGFPESPELKVGEDYALWLRIATQTDFAYIGQPLMVYLDDPGNSVRADSLDGWSERVVVLRDFLTWSDDAGAKVASGMRMRARYEILYARCRRGVSALFRFFREIRCQKR